MTEKDRVEKLFLDHVKHLIEFWDNSDKETTKEKLEGLAKSILLALDGCASSVPTLIIAPYGDNDRLPVVNNIAGSLHKHIAFNGDLS